MTTAPTRLTPHPAKTRYPALAGCTLRVYNDYQALLSRPAWEALGSPPAIAIEYDDRGYSIVATTLGDASAIRVYKHRAVSIGVIAAALRGLPRPLTIELEEEHEITSGIGFGGGITRLRFGDVG